MPTEDARDFVTFKAIQVAAWVVLYHDTIVTLPDEVNLMWRRKRTASTWLYFATRYLAFFDSIIFLYQETHTFLTPLVFKVTNFLIGGSYVLGIAVISQIILVMRTYALCGRNKRILAGIICSEVICLGLAAFFAIRFVTLLSSHTGSLGGSSEIEVWLTYLFIFIAETILMAVTILYLYFTQAFNEKTEFRTPLIRVIYRDGICFYIFLQVFSFVNIMVLIFTPAKFKDSFIGLHRVLHALFTARILLHIREAATTPASSVALSTFKAAPGARPITVDTSGNSRSRIEEPEFSSEIDEFEDYGLYDHLPNAAEARMRGPGGRAEMV